MPQSSLEVYVHYINDLSGFVTLSVMVNQTLLFSESFSFPKSLAEKNTDETTKDIYLFGYRHRRHEIISSSTINKFLFAFT